MIRIIETNENDGAMNMAIDEALLIIERERGFPPALRVYKFVPPTLSIGYFQKMEKEVNFAHCKELGIGYVRRPTGGRAVLHDRELTYSVTMAHPHSILEMNLLDSFHYLCEGIIEAISLLGGNAYFSDREDNEISSPSCFAAPTFSDILLNGKKVVGSAQRRNDCGLLQHGSILYHVDLEQIFYCFNLDENARKRLVELSKKKISSLSDELNKEITFDVIKVALKRGMEKITNETLVPTELTKDEKNLAEKLYHEKYNTYKWNFKR
ncbi:MAG: biotin/lipoate A/B protein ligase family protein [Caldisericota bacterium]|nr:biotin/lipoate A/B protein ligase family protein [Caldisericota bacterium]